MRKNYFHILNLESSASEEDIKQAYRFLAKRYHPDVNHSPEAHDKFVEISEAYEFLLGQLSSSARKTVNYDPEDTFNQEYFEEMRRKARERAKEQARMRFEKLKREHEAFQESGLYDIGLLASYVGRYAMAVFCLVLVIWPVILSIGFTDAPYVLRAIMFMAGSFGLYFIFKNAKTYFFAGSFFYNYQQIKKYFAFKNEEVQDKCFYSPGYKADSRPYKVSMIKIKDIQLHNYGPGQHSVAFDQKSITLSIPRSHHALIVHAYLIAIKLLILLGCVFLLDITSILWRVILAFMLSLLVTEVVLLITNTKSTITYLLTTGLILRAVIWLILFTVFSRFQLSPFNIFTYDIMNALIVFMFIFDTFLDQFLSFISNKRFKIPLIKQHPLIESYLSKKYQFGYDMPFLSVFYPIFKWFLG